MTQRKVSELLLRYAVEGSQKILTENTKQIKSLQDLRKAADAAYEGRVAQLADEKKQTVTTLADIRKSADAAYSARVTQLTRENELQTQQVSAARAAFTSQQAQVPLAQRLADAEAARANAARQGLTAQQQMLDTLRSQSGFVSATGGAGGGAPGVSTIGGRISGASRALFNLPDVALPGGVSSTTVSRLGILAGAAADNLQLTTVQFAALAAGGVALGLVIKTVADQFAAARQRAQDFIAEQGKIAELIAGGGTREDLEAARDKAVSEQQGAQQTADRGRALLQAYQDASRELQNQLNTVGFTTSEEDRAASVQRLRDAEQAIRDFFGVVPSDPGGFPAINAAIDKMQQKADKAAVAVASANLSLQNNETAANDAEAALERLTEAQLNSADRALELDRLTKDQREERIRQNERDVNVLTRLVGEGGLTAEALTEVATRISELNTETEQLRNTSSSYGDELEREQAAKEALTEKNQQLIDLATQQVEAYEEIYAINQRISDIIADAGARIDEITADRDERLLELEEDAADQREKIISDSNDKIAKILRDSGRSINEAIARRDVLSFTLAAERREDALDDEQDALEKSLENVEANLDKQEKAIDKSYRKQVDSVSSNSQRQVEILQRGLREQEHIISTSQTSQQFLAQSGAIKVISEHAKMYTALEGEAYIAGTKLPNAFRTGVEVGLGQSPIGGRLPIGGGDGGLGIGQLGTFRGAVPPLTPQVNRSSVGMINIPVTVNGASEDVVIERVRTAYRKAMQQMNNG